MLSETEARVSRGPQVKPSSVRSQVDHLLREIADDREFGVILIPASGDWLYHPYTGGADVIAASVEHRDELAGRFADWLSSHPEGV